MKLKRLKTCHPRFDRHQIETLKALYVGGDHLLGNDELMNDIFPKFIHEKDAVYAERKKRAFYEPIFGQVINQISAHLAQDPVVLEVPEEKKIAPAPPKKPPPPEMTEDEEEDDEAEEEDGEEEEEFEEEEEEEEEFPPLARPVETVELDQFWKDFQECATPPGDEKRSLDQLIRDAAIEALATGWSWMQIDLPKPDQEPTSLMEQEERGDLDAYLVLWPTDQVTDWSEKDGQLNWVRTYQIERPDDDPEKDREEKHHVWTIWTRESATRYVVIETKDKPLSGKSDEEDISPEAPIPHTFGRVPFLRLDTYQKKGSNLHVGDQIKSLCVAYFNRSNGESFQWTQFCFQQLYEFLAPEVAGIDTPISEAQQDPNRARRTRSPGQVHVRGENDKAMYVGPNMAGAEVGRAATQDIRDSILRVINMMALSQDTSGAMLRRSGDSKKQDNVAQEILVGAIGKILATFARSVVELAATARGEPDNVPCVEGYQNFDVTDAEGIINRAAIVEAMDIPSATYQQERKFQLAVIDLGDAATPEMREKIRAELESAITQDQIEMSAMPPEDPFAAEEEELPDEEEEESPFPPKGKKPPPKKGKTPFA